MPIYTNDPDFDEDVVHLRTPLRSSVGIGPKVINFIKEATKDWLDKHPEATTTVEDGSINSSKLAENSVTTEKIEDGSIVTQKLGNGSVTTSKLDDEAVTTSRLADNSVTTQKLADRSVTSDKLASNTIPTMSENTRGIAKVGSGLAMNGDRLELDGSGDIGAAVSSWLDDHPEATTTVADGSITYPKLADGVFDFELSGTKVVETSHNFHPYENTPNADNSLSIADESGNVLLSTSDLAHTTRKDVSAYNGLAIADDSGNVIFDAVSGWPNTLAGKTFSVLGDSISTFSGWIPSGYSAYYPRNTADVDDVHKTWWKSLEDTTGMRLIKTASWSGSRISGDSTDSTGGVGCSDARIQALSGDDNESPDIVIVFIGTNDLSSGSHPQVGHADYTVRPSEGTQSTISDAYLLALYKIHETYPNAHVFCATLLPRRMSEIDIHAYKNANGDTTFEINEEIRRLAAAMNCSVIDFESCGFNINNMDDYFFDNRLHPNTAGMMIMAKAARKALELHYIS